MTEIVSVSDLWKQLIFASKLMHVRRTFLILVQLSEKHKLPLLIFDIKKNCTTNNSTDQ